MSEVVRLLARGIPGHGHAAADGAGAFPAGDSKCVDRVGLKFMRALDLLNRSPSPCPTNRNKDR